MMLISIYIAYFCMLVIANVLLASILMKMDNKKPTIKQAFRSIVAPSGAFSVKSKRTPIANDDQKAYIAENKEHFPQTFHGRE